MQELEDQALVILQLKEALEGQLAGRAEAATKVQAEYERKRMEVRPRFVKP